MRSVLLALNRVTRGVELVESPEAVSTCDRVVLPGVGHFATYLQSLAARGFSLEALRRIAQTQQTLAICVGMQILGLASEEAPGVPGLGLVDCEVKHLSNLGESPSHVPHLGWSRIELATSLAPSGSLLAIQDRDVYFMHSYAVPGHCAGTLATCNEGGRFAAVIRGATATGVQFHPERSQAAGLDFLREWVRET